MTAKKAREIILEYIKFNTIVNDQDFINALKLGSESLRRQLAVRADRSFIGPWLLPGETSDE